MHDKLEHERKKTKEKVDEGKGKKKQLLILLVCLLIPTSLSVGMLASPNIKKIVGNLFRGSPKVEADVDDYLEDIRVRPGNLSSLEKGELSTSDMDAEQERLNKLAEESRVSIIISSSPYFNTVNDKGSLFISNPEDSNFHTQVVIETADKKEMYVSPLLAPNEKVEYDYLTDKTFNKGSYDALATFNYYTTSAETGDYVYFGSMCAEVTVVIDNEITVEHSN